MLSLKLWRRVRQKPCESEVPVGGGTTDVSIFIYAPGRVIVVGVNHGIPIGEARMTVPNVSVPIALRGRGVGWDHFVGMT